MVWFFFFAKPENFSSQLEAKFYINENTSCQDHIFVSHMEVCLGEEEPLSNLKNNDVTFLFLVHVGALQRKEKHNGFPANTGILLNQDF